MSDKENNPLVSVTVVTYNSSATIIETLDSIAAQTYQNIELIVSDDCSTDNTVGIVRGWINEHKSRFVRCELLTSDKNTGPSGNYNRALDACKGEWLKEFDGDDVMLPSCIHDCVDYVMEHPEIEFLFSKVEAFGYNQKVVERYNNGDVFDYSLFEQSSKKQWESFVYGDAHIPSPSLFCRICAMNKYGVRNDERIPFTEDEPKWINLLKAGAHLDFMDKVTVLYRVGHKSSLSSSSEVYSPVRFESICKFFIYYKFEERYKKDSNQAIQDLMEFISRFYKGAYRYKNSYAYKIGHLILTQYYWINSLLKK